MIQQIVAEKVNTRLIIEFMIRFGAKKPMLVCGKSFDIIGIKDEIYGAAPCLVRFGGFLPNPEYDDIVKGVKLFNAEGCDMLIAVGGGSAIDVAKCIKLFCGMDDTKSFLEQRGIDTNVPFIAIPTTAGSGSESTPNAVIYHHGVKQSVAHFSLLPHLAILDYTLLDTLPEYQKKCTVFDALCQALESWWSLKSTFESRDLAKSAVILIKDNIDDYLTVCSENAKKNIMLASNLAGQAICLTTTTVPHGMAYKLTTGYGLAHGHAVALCLPAVWEKMIDNPAGCCDLRGWNFLLGVLNDITNTLGFKNGYDAVNWFRGLLKKYDIKKPEINGEEALEEIVAAFDRKKTKNHPVTMTNDAIREAYRDAVVL